MIKMNYFDYLKQLHDLELYHDLKQLASILMTICDSQSETEVPSISQKYQCLVYHGNALFHLGEYTKAEETYKRALLLRKAINNVKGKTPVPSIASNELTSDVEVKFKIYLCLMQSKQYKEAMSVLEGISTRQRTAKVNLALADLYVRSGMDRSAITSYKEVLRECPLALEAINGLLSLGQKGADVHALVISSLPQGISKEWLSQWIRGHSLVTSNDYVNAVKTFRLDTNDCLKDNEYMITSIARALFLDGHYKQSLVAFQKAHAIDPLHLTHMDIYSYLLYKEKKGLELQRLANQLMSATVNAPEPWVAMGYLSLYTKKNVRSVYYAQKAMTIDSLNIEALLMKATAFLELKQINEATNHFHAAIKRAPLRFEAYVGLTECYTGRVREAIALAGRALKTMGPNSRTLWLYGAMIAKDPLALAKAKPYLEKAMKLDPTHLNPVYVMADILKQEKQYDKGVELLRGYLVNQSTSKLHLLLGDFLTVAGDQQEALDQYNKALGIDPTNELARQGIERVENGESGADNTFDVEMEHSVSEADFDGSDVESTWSDELG
ncbi:anaphase-promoting complex subunit 7-like isoform X1 [Dreissena polymorpha]|uniref:anaphase-promoting complex subunit 7-like isoform X1 n=1 Tax=Dreissena polymorpha TaxID=45954 RepID=UPI002264A609|nr:anaphase-promoting complex subunit 7-like isoform X1 [Dreissena polymorpha]